MSRRDCRDRSRVIGSLATAATPRSPRLRHGKTVDPARPRILAIGTLRDDGGRDAQERPDGGRGGQSERRVRFHLRAAPARSGRRRFRLSHGLRRAHRGRSRRAYRRLLHLGLAQAGAADHRAHRSPALASRPLRRLRVQRQCHLCRRGAEPYGRAARPLHARPCRGRRLLRRLELCVDLGDQPGDARDRDRSRRLDPRRAPARARRDQGRAYGGRDRRAPAARRLQHAGRRIRATSSCGRCIGRPRPPASPSRC